MTTKKMVEDIEHQQIECTLLNRYLVIGWGIIAAILAITYGIEVIKGVFSMKYYIAFLCATVLPFCICLLVCIRKPDSASLRYMILAGYYVMYGFVLLTGHTQLVFTYVFPLLCLVILYHDPHLILQMGVTALLLNLLMILRDYRQGVITMVNSRDYEIQIALIVLCFGGCYLATYVYGRISELNKIRAREVMRLQEERIILEERNRYVLHDSLTGLGNRRKYDEDMTALEMQMPSDLVVAIVDVNNLKNVNDTIGHRAGDELIISVANIIRRDFDGCNCYRMGGDEFAIVWQGPVEDFRAKVETYRNSLTNWKGIYSSQLSAAIGYACSQEAAGATVGELMHRADAAMYQEKQQYYTVHPKLHI